MTRQFRRAGIYPTTTSAAAVTPHGPPGVWDVVFNDDFDGATVDATKWNVHNTTYSGWTYNAADVWVANSILSVRLSSATSGGRLETAGGFIPDVGSNRFLAQVGDYVEFRALIPGNGTQIYNWPALWTSGPGGSYDPGHPAGWPAQGEIDIAEAMKNLTVSYHGQNPDGSPYDVNGINPGGYWGDAWHTFGAHRKADSVDFYWDGILKQTIATKDAGGGHELIINNYTDPATFGGPLQVGAVMQVDYARVFRPALTPHGPAGTWDLVFSDDFDGGSLDATKWNVTDGVSINGVTTAASNVTVAGSILTLHLSSPTSGALIDTAGFYSGGGATNHFTAQVGDYVEYRALFQGDGSTLVNWPAVWTVGTGNIAGIDPAHPAGWPAQGEIDIAETGTGVLTHNYHGQTSGGTPVDVNGSQPGYWGGWHTYGAHRKSDSVDWYWDGVLVFTAPSTDSGGLHDLIINIGNGNGNPLLVGGTLQVDYARVFRPA